MAATRYFSVEELVLVLWILKDIVIDDIGYCSLASVADFKHLQRNVIQLLPSQDSTIV